MIQHTARLAPFLFGLSLAVLWAMPADAAESKSMRAAIGAFEVFAIADSYRDLDAGLFLAPAGEQAASVKAAYPSGRARNALNVFVVRSQAGTLLVDAGGGTLLGPEPGGLPRVLAELGIAPEAVDTVLITHAHRDHVGGLAPDGKAAFPKATVCIARTEHEFWMNPENLAKVPERSRGAFKALADMLAPYAGRVKLVEPGPGPLPGTTLLAAYGHTPGHLALLLESQDRRLLLWGDLLHGLDLQAAHPDIAIAFDLDPAAAVASRRALLSRAAKEGWLVSGVHVPAPALYSLRASGSGYAATQAP
ncbi:MAG: MBL fold metallo-hydrolase [Thermodesulfobacteriota bacterium]